MDRAIPELSLARMALPDMATTLSSTDGCGTCCWTTAPNISTGLAWFRTSPPAGTVYYLADGLGSTMALVDGTGTVVQTYDYDAFGKVRGSSGSQSTEFQFAGQQTDPSGLQYLRACYYDPTTGRLLSRDPLSLGDPAGHHPYGYAANNPALSGRPRDRP